MVDWVKTYSTSILSNTAVSPTVELHYIALTFYRSGDNILVFIQIEVKVLVGCKSLLNFYLASK